MDGHEYKSSGDEKTDVKRQQSDVKSQTLSRDRGDHGDKGEAAR